MRRLRDNTRIAMRTDGRQPTQTESNVALTNTMRDRYIVSAQTRRALIVLMLLVLIGLVLNILTMRAYDAHVNRNGDIACQNFKIEHPTWMPAKACAGHLR